MVKASLDRRLLGLSYGSLVERPKQYVRKKIIEVCLDCVDGLAGLVAGLIDSEGNVRKRCRLVDIAMTDGELLEMVRTRLCEVTGRFINEYRPPKRGLGRLIIPGSLPRWFWRKVVAYVAHPSRRLKLLRLLIDDYRTEKYRRLVAYAYKIADVLDSSVDKCLCREVASEFSVFMDNLVWRGHGPQAAQAAAPAPPLVLALVVLVLATSILLHLKDLRCRASRRELERLREPRC